MKTILLVMSVCISAPVAAQHSIKGQVQDSLTKGIPFVSVALINEKDSVMVKSTSGDESGMYLFENIKPGNYKVAATAIGFNKSQSLPFEVNAGTWAPALVMSATTAQLKEVQVTTKRPFVEQMLDRTVVNVAGSIVGSGSTALEVLAKSPGVTVDYQNDLIQLRGKEGVIIQIDGKQTYMSAQDAVAVLRSMSSDNIDRIELITNPSARYDAAGNSGIINIRLKKNNNAGTNGSLSLAGGTGYFDRERAGIQLNHRAKKVNLFGSYNLNRGGNYWNFWKFSDQPDPSQENPNRRNIVEQTTWLSIMNTGHNAKAGVDYFVNSKTTIGVVWTGLWNASNEEGPAPTWFRRSVGGPIYLKTETNKTLSNTTQNQLGNLNFQHNFAGKGGQLNADIDAGHFGRKFTNSLASRTVISSEQPAAGNSGLLSGMPSIIDIFTVKADYMRPLTAKIKLETGLKTASVKTDNDLSISTGSVGELYPDSSLSNRFKYTERVNAAYASISGKLDAQTDFQIGLRAEHTHSIGNSLTMNQKATRRYLKLFPSVFITKPISARQTITFSYSYRIDRPNYVNLNPSRSYIDPYTYSLGNPYLRPQFTHAIELKHGFKGGFYSSFAVNFSKDFFQSINYVKDGNQLYRTMENIGSAKGYIFTLSFPVTVTKGWQMQTNMLGYFNQYKFQYQEFQIAAKNFAGRVNVNNGFTLGKGWTAELNSWVNTPKLDVIFKMSWSGSVDFGIQKSVSSALKLKFSMQDIFHTIVIKGAMQAPNNYQRVSMNFDTRVALLSLTYNFGNQQLKGARQRKTGSEDETKRAN